MAILHTNSNSIQDNNIGETKMADTAEKKLCEFMVPISEAVTVGNEFIIKGIAINATTTRNGVTYTSEELSKAAHTLTGKPILKDHENSIDNIVGKVKSSSFDNGLQAIPFEGRIMEEKYKEMIKDGRINSVSIGAMVKDVEEICDEETGEMSLIPRGIDFVELSLVAVPADPNANFARAICEKFTRTKKDNSEVNELKFNIEKVGLQIGILKCKKMMSAKSSKNREVSK